MKNDQPQVPETETSMSPTPTQPESAHENSVSHLSIIVAVLGVLTLVALVAAGLFWLPGPVGRGDAPGQISQIDDEEPTARADIRQNPVQPVKTMQLMTVANAKERGAVCNDGSPAKYYFRPGTEADKDKWIIYFQGGGGCGSEESCLLRQANDDPDLLSSKTYAATNRNDGIFSVNEEQNADFDTWNHVKLMYCSSDTWAGSTEQIIAGETWYFHGKAIVDAIVDDLQDASIIKTANLKSASEVLVAGSSAGGSGVTHNLDDIANELSWADVKGIIDSSWAYEVDEPYLVSAEFEERDRRENKDYQNKVLDDTCLAANVGTEENCTFLATVYPHIETPVFIFMNQYDKLKLENLGVTQPFDIDEQTWLETTYIPALLDSFKVIDDGLFAPRKTFHTLLTSERYVDTAINGVTMQEVFTNWYFERAGDTYLVE